jgi:hypothetical protein
MKSEVKLPKLPHAVAHIMTADDSEDVFTVEQLEDYAKEYGTLCYEAGLAAGCVQEACPCCGMTDWRDFYTGPRHTHDVCASCNYLRVKQSLA